MRFSVRINFDELSMFFFKFAFNISITLNNIFFISLIAFFIKSTIISLTFLIKIFLILFVDDLTLISSKLL